MFLKNFIISSWNSFNKLCDLLTPVGDLFIRCWVGKAFIASGLTKISSWSSTLLLFQYEGPPILASRHFRSHISMHRIGRINVVNSWIRRPRSCPHTLFI